jgi:hypothetical protein
MTPTQDIWTLPEVQTPDNTGYVFGTQLMNGLVRGVKYHWSKFKWDKGDKGDTWLQWIQWPTPAWWDLAWKPTEFPPSGHTHTKSQISDFDHTHPISHVTWLESALNDRPTKENWSRNTYVNYTPVFLTINNSIATVTNLDAKYIKRWKVVFFDITFNWTWIYEIWLAHAWVIWWSVTLNTNHNIWSQNRITIIWNNIRTDIYPMGSANWLNWLQKYSWFYMIA